MSTMENTVDMYECVCVHACMHAHSHFLCHISLWLWMVAEKRSKINLMNELIAADPLILFLTPKFWKHTYHILTLKVKLVTCLKHVVWYVILKLLFVTSASNITTDEQNVEMKVEWWLVFSVRPWRCWCIFRHHLEKVYFSSKSIHVQHFYLLA
jgi:hypothetical protein